MKKLLTPNKTNRYLTVHLKKDKKSYTEKIHRLVAMTYLPNKDNKK